MRILFIYPVPPETNKVYTGYYHGIGYLSSVLKKHGHDTALLILSSLRQDLIKDKIEVFKPGLIAVSTTSLQSKLSAEIIKFVSANFKIPVVLGGIHPTLSPEDSIKIDGLLGIVRGEGEYPLLELADALQKGTDYRSIKNFWFNSCGKITKNEMRPLADLDLLPFPDRDIYDYQALLDRNRVTVGAEFMAGRGCPYECAYCSNHGVKNLYARNGAEMFVRKRSAKNLISEIESVVGRYKNISILGFHDDIFPLENNWFSEFAQTYKAKIGIPFWCNSRVDLLDEEKLIRLKNSGCVRLHMGVESGSERLKKGVLKRSITNSQVMETFALAKRIGFKTVAFNMIGLPGETAQDIEETIALNRVIRPDWLVVSIFYPFPGTDLYSKCLSDGSLNINRADSYYDGAAAGDNLSIAREALLNYYEKFVEKVYK